MYYPFTKKAKNKFGIVVSSGYGMRVGGFHYGTDYAPKSSSYNIPILASARGNLTTRTDQYGALYYDIDTDSGMRVRGVHLDRFVKKGGRVKPGDLIGYMGTTGKSTGIHIHFEIWNNKNSWRTRRDPEKAKLKYLDNLIFNQSEVIKLRFGKSYVHKIKVRVIADELVVRSKPTTNSKPLTTIKKGDIFHPTKFARGEKIDGNPDWTYLSTQRGWVATRWLSVVTDNPAKELLNKIKALLQ